MICEKRKACLEACNFRFHAISCTSRLQAFLSATACLPETMSSLLKYWRKTQCGEYFMSKDIHFDFLGVVLCLKKVWTGEHRFFFHGAGLSMRWFDFGSTIYDKLWPEGHRFSSLKSSVLMMPLPFLICHCTPRTRNDATFTSLVLYIADTHGLSFGYKTSFPFGTWGDSWVSADPVSSSCSAWGA